MKKQLGILILLIFTLTACSSEKAVKNFQNSDLILMDANNFYLCSLNESARQVSVDDILKNPKNKEDLGYLNWFDAEDEKQYYVKTQTSKRRKTYLQTISKETLSVNSVELKNDYYSSCLYKEKLYAVSSFVDGVAYIVLDVYNSDLSLAYSKKFEYDVIAMLPGALVVDDEKIYVICGLVEENTDYAEKATYLFEFDLEFNFLNEIDLQLDDAGYQSAVKIDNIIFLAKTMQGVDENKVGIGTKYVDKYNLDTELMEQNAIELQQTHPVRIKHDTISNNLIILHDRWSTGNNYYSIYNLENESVHTILLDNKMYGEEFIFQAQHKECYYFQSPDRLGVFDYENKTMEEYDLKPLNLELSNGIFFTN